MEFKELYPGIVEQLDHMRYQAEKRIFSSETLGLRAELRKKEILKLTEKFGEIDYNNLNQGYLAVDLDQRTVSFVGEDITNAIKARSEGNYRIVYFDKEKAKKENVKPWSESISLGKIVIESFKLKQRSETGTTFPRETGGHPFKSW